MQLQVFTGCTDGNPPGGCAQATGMEAVLYEDVNDPRGVGVLTMGEGPAFFVTGVRFSSTAGFSQACCCVPSSR